MNKLKLLIVVLTLCPVAALSQPNGWNDPFPPHRVMDNVYFVGTKELASFLITTPQGHILMNSNYEASVPVIQASVKELGFNFKDIKILISGHAHPGATVRLYLNDSFVASATAAEDGRLAVTINQGVAPGNYRVRLDEVESGTAKVRARAEVPFNVPDTVVAGSVRAPAMASNLPEAPELQEPRLAAAEGAVAPDTNSPSSVVVPKITTATVSRGDSLWRISQRTMGAGQRYAVIYRANKGQIRNPNLIYPGQIFVLPTQ